MATATNKAWYESKAIWGGIIAILSLVLNLFGYGIGAKEQLVLVDYAVTIGGMVGGITAIYGRVVAKKRVGK